MNTTDEHYSLGMIRTRDSSNKAAVDLGLRHHGQRDLHFTALLTLQSLLDMSDAPKLGMRLFLPVQL
jgi:hypothetical protein